MQTAKENPAIPSPSALPLSAASHVPVVLLSVVSKDSWGRVLPCGYASVPLPAAPGTTSADVPTWIPEGSVREKMGNFFLGGAATMRDVDYAWVPSGFDAGSQVCAHPPPHTHTHTSLLIPRLLCLPHTPPSAHPRQLGVVHAGRPLPSPSPSLSRPALSRAHA
jgi:hypothetical protein